MSEIGFTEDIKDLIAMSDPLQKSKMVAAGLPTIKLDEIKDMAAKQLEQKKASMLDSIKSGITSVTSAADKMIQDLVAKKDKQTSLPTSMPKLPSVPGYQSTESVEKAIADLKKAKQYAMDSGNFVPLLALTKPDLSLKHLKKETVFVPDTFTPPADDTSFI